MLYYGGFDSVRDSALPVEPGPEIALSVYLSAEDADNCKARIWGRLSLGVFHKRNGCPRHRPTGNEIESMSNDKVPTRIHALKIGAQAAGALALGALAIGALAIGALAIGRLVIGRSRIRRLEIDELVVARLHVTNLLTVPSTLAVETSGGRNNKVFASINPRQSIGQSTSSSGFSLGSG